MGRVSLIEGSKVDTGTLESLGKLGFFCGVEGLGVWSVVSKAGSRERGPVEVGRAEGAGFCSPGKGLGYNSPV